MKMTDETNGGDVDDGEVKRDGKRTVKMMTKPDENVSFLRLLCRYLCYSQLWSVVVYCGHCVACCGSLWFVVSVVVSSHTGGLAVCLTPVSIQYVVCTALLLNIIICLPGRQLSAGPCQRSSSVVFCQLKDTCHQTDLQQLWRQIFLLLQVLSSSETN